MLSYLCHPNIPFIFGMIDEKCPGLVIEFHGDIVKMCSLTLFDAIKRSQEISASVWLKIISCLCSAFAYVHESGILHNDIKGNNILLTLKHSEWVPMIIDFGKASYIKSKQTYPPFTEEQLKKYKDSYRHIAPELYIQRVPKSVHSDIYSFGWMLKTISQCFPEKDISNVFQNCLHSCPRLRPPSMSALENMITTLV